MKKINKILVPTDFSVNSVIAYQHAQQIAESFGAQIDLIHVIPTLKYFNDSISQLGAPISMDSDIYPKIQEQTSEKLTEQMQMNIAEEYRGELLRPIHRRASSKICEVANEGEYDLIIMASKGGHGTPLLRGSTTEKIIRHSQVPVFTVDDSLGIEGLGRILVPTDGSDISFSALPIALSLAEIYDAELTLFHAIELYGSPMQDVIGSPQQSDESNIYTALIDSLESYLADNDEVSINRHKDDFEDQLVISHGASNRSVHLKTVIDKGVSAHLAIEDYASENADMVVMTTHGHSGLAHFFLGSTTEKVSQHLSIPVLTVKPEKQKLNVREEV
ncbi:universal stress protein [Fodinibius halophilus]|uniref:Universal stress protein n=1 Tax=Fodinibius halophilus TaxID=1736908 RepID=A0A6M1TM28_9BACT|nr:universal stress protein [Fodinibius halophilus]NGP89490.1 universal stress protein [Fodinibius halophilus]